MYPSSIAIVRTSRGTTNTLCRLPLQRKKRAHHDHCNGNLHKESISGVCMNFWVRVYSCSLGFIYTCCVRYLGFVCTCTCCVLWGLFITVGIPVVFSWVHVYLLCYLGFVCTCTVCVCLLCSLGFVCICCVHLYLLYLLCSLGFIYTVVFSGVCNCCILWGLFISVVFSGVCNCCVLWGLFVSVVFSGVCNCCVLWGLFVSVVFSGVCICRVLWGL